MMLRVTVGTLKKTARVVLAAGSVLALSGCADPLTMLAGGAKGFCTHNPGSGPCARPGPTHMPGAPPR